MTCDTFLAVAREGSTGAAAKALGVNQSTVQRRLLALENGLGCVLAERHATGYRLTEHGQTLLASVTDVEVPSMRWSAGSPRLTTKTLARSG